MSITRSGLRKTLRRAAGAAATAAALSACAAAPARARHLSSGCPGQRTVALTFDDGPNPPYTAQILDVLNGRGVKATFFAEGEATTAHPELVRAELSSGMAVGSHSYGHATELPTMSQEAFAADLVRAEDALVSATGARPEFYRSPFGHTSNTMLEEERRRGYTSIGWDIDSEDWSDAAVDRVVSNVLDQAHNGAIVLMHDGGLGGGNADRSTTLAAVPRIIDGLRGMGYGFATVPEITGRSGGVEASC